MNDETLYSILKEKFGYETFRKGQKEIIETILDGKDCVALLPTGTGKSLCFQLPGYVFDTPVLIISPLVSLMQDQVQQLKKSGEKRVVALNSLLAYKQKRQLLNHLDTYRFIYVSPEMLQEEYVQQALSQLTLSLIVIDEAHCISQWGYDFRPDYLRLREWIGRQPHRSILALTATATDQVILDIEHYLNLREPVLIKGDVNRPNVHYFLQKCGSNEEKMKFIINYVKTYEGAGVIYVSSRAKADEMARELQANQIVASAYHAGLEMLDRSFIQQQFLDGQLEWIVATNAFGMGVHKDNIRHVIHEQMPASVSSFVQESGRAGRDGLPSFSTTLYSEGDEDTAFFIATSELPSPTLIDDFANAETKDEWLHTIPETTRRMLTYWLQHQHTNDVKELVKRLYYEKRQEVNALKTILLSNDCIRQGILSYYKQSETTQQTICCTSCGASYEIIPKRQNEHSNSNSFPTWQQRFGQLLPNSVG